MEDNNPEVIFVEAEKLEKLGEYNEAEKKYSSFIERCFHCMHGDRNNTQEIRKKCLQLLPLAYNNRGYSRYRQVEFVAAVGDYTESLKLSQTATTLYNRGLIHYRLGRFDQAIADMNEALSIDPAFKPAQDCLEQAIKDKDSYRKNAIGLDT